MKYLILVWSALWRRKARTLLTMLSIAVAFLLFGLLQGINLGMDRIYKNLNVDRLYVLRRINMNDGLPLSQWERIKNVPGVSAVTHWSYFGAFIKTRTTATGLRRRCRKLQFAVYPKIKIPKEQVEAMIHTRTGRRHQQATRRAIRLEDRRSAFRSKVPFGQGRTAAIAIRWRWSASWTSPPTTQAPFRRSTSTTNT